MSAQRPVAALVVAAGLGTRLPLGPPKGVRLLGGDPLFLHSLSAFDSAPSIDRCLLVVPGDLVDSVRVAAVRRVAKPLDVLAGGARRQDSVLVGLRAALDAKADSAPAPGESLVAVHDAARPFVDTALIERTVAAALNAGAAIPMIPIADTVREVGEAGGTPRRLERARLRVAQTPQTARLDWLVEAYERVRADGAEVTDEGAALERIGRSFAVVDGASSNFKITTAEDLEIAEALLASKRGPRETRLGYGEDRHRRAESRPFVLAGVVLDVKGGPIGHSDADPLCHAIVDALLGAAGAGTIGDLFPDTDARWAGAPGLDLLARTVEHLSMEGWTAVNIDAVVIADAPRLSTGASEIRKRIAAVLGVEEGAVSVKGKRAEGLGFEGAGEGVSCRAVAQIGRARHR